MVPTPHTSTSALHSDQHPDRENDADSVGMQSSEAESEELNDPQVEEGSDKNMLLEESSSSSTSSGSDVELSASSSGGEGYSADCSASDQASDQCFDCAARRQKKQVRSTMKAALNRVDLSYDASSSEMESSIQQGEVTDPGTISSASKAKASSSTGTGTAKKRLSSSLEVKKNGEATISASAAVTAPGLSSSFNKQNRRHLCSNHHRRRSRPRPRARDDSPSHWNALLASDDSHKELANNPMFDTTTQALPQWKGVRISHPMDPRIDISTVRRNVQGQAPVPVLAATSPASLPAVTSRNGSTRKNGDTGSTSNSFVATQSPSFDPPSMETYMQLLTVS
jgi:hypothetical protein